MKKVVKKLKRQFKKLKGNPIYAIAAAILVVLVIATTAVLLFTGGEDGDGGDIATDDKKRSKDGRDATKARKLKPAPLVDGSGRLDTARSIGRLAIAQARGRIKNPSGVRVTVSAAPKQPVTVTWMLSCYREAGKTSTTRVGQGRYRTTPPDTRSLQLPMTAAKECTTTVGAQLTRGGSNGRVKVSVVAG